MNSDNDAVLYSDDAGRWTGDVYAAWKRLTDELGPPNPAVIRESARDGNLIVAIVGNRLAGFVQFRIRRDGIATIYDIATVVPYRGRGIARSLVEMVRDRSPKKTVRLKVVATNPANAFYDRIGFRFIGTDAGRKRPLNVWELG